MHRFEREAAPLAAAGSPELRRFLAGLWAWMGGNRAYEPSALAVIAFAITWACMGLIQLVARFSKFSSVKR